MGSSAGLHLTDMLSRRERRLSEKQTVTSEAAKAWDPAMGVS
jgi:hypothetical protein